MTQIYNRESEKKLRRRLRGEMPRAEVVLWSKLRGKQLEGHKFRRQFSIGPYVVDFHCPLHKLAVEVDGDSHFGDLEEKRDSTRQKYIESFGVRVLRFRNDEVYRNLGSVLDRIVEALESVEKDPPVVPPY